MHSEAYEYIKKRVGYLGDLSERRVLEVGSYNVNGTPRPLFAGVAKYTGVDIRSGPSVDAMLDLTEWFPIQPYDVVVCAETLEHASDVSALVGGMIDALGGWGTLIITCACHPRLAHDVDGGTHLGDQHYANIDPAWLERELESLGCRVIDKEIHESRGDLYMTAEYRFFDSDESE